MFSLRVNAVGVLFSFAFASLVLASGGQQVAFDLADPELTQASGAIGGCSGGCANQTCNRGNAFFEYDCQIRNSGRGNEYHKKVASGNTVAICDNTRNGGCNFGTTEKICFTVYMCGNDRTCTDCQEDPYYVPDTCTADN